MPTAVLLCMLTAGVLLGVSRPHACRRLARLTSRPRPARAVPAVVREGAVAVAVMLGCTMLLGGPAGPLCGLAGAAVCVRTLRRAEPKAHRRRRERITTDLPPAVDLLAACLAGGMTWHDSVEAVAEAIGGPLGEELRAVAVQVRLGAEPAAAWLAAAREPVLAPLARAVARAAGSGSSLAPTLRRLAEDRRRESGAAAAARARAAGIKAVAPLGLCFLPAFVLLGIVPAVAGIAASMFVPW